MNEDMNTISAIAAAIAAVASMVTVIISVVQQHQMKKHDDLKTESEQILLWYNIREHTEASGCEADI